MRCTTKETRSDANGTGPTQGGIVGTTLTTAQTGTPTTGANLPGGIPPGGGPPIVTFRSVSISLAIPLANGEPIDFRWITTGNDPSGGNAHFAVDNLSVTALAVPEPGTFQMLVLAFGVVGLRRFLPRRRTALACARCEGEAAKI